VLFSGQLKIANLRTSQEVLDCHSW